MKFKIFISKNRYLILFALVSIFILLTCINLPYFIGKYYTYLYDSNYDKPSLGELGDIYGSINAFFTGITFAGIIITILLQKQELNAQRQELQETRHEFITTRITNILFKQLEKIELITQLMPFRVNNAGSKVYGLNSIIQANEYLESVTKSINSADPHHYKTNLIYLEENQSSLINIINSIHNGHVLLSKIINTHQMTEIEKNQLIDLFNTNINSEIIDYIKNIRVFLNHYLNSSYAKKGDYAKYVDSFSALLNKLSVVSYISQ